MSDKLAFLEKLGQDATEEPWVDSSHHLIHKCPVVHTPANEYIAGCRSAGFNGHHNATFITQSRNHWQALIDVAKASEERQSAEAAIQLHLQNYQNHH